MTVSLIVLDENIAYGFKSAAGGWSTGIVPLSGGMESRNQNWIAPRRRYDFSFGDKSQSDIQTIVAFVESRRGALHPWLLKDWLAYQLTNELVLTAVGGETTVQIIQTLGTNNAFARDIENIKSGTLTVKRNGGTLTPTTHYTVNSTGLITMVSPASLTAADTITVTCEYYIKVRFEQDFLAPSIEFFNTARISSISAIEVLS